MATTPTVTYTANPEGSPVDAIRLIVGDTDCATAYLSDSEMRYFIGKGGSPEGGAPLACEAIAAVLAREVNVRAGSIWKDCGEAMQHYLDLAKRLRAEGNKLAGMWAGGIDPAEEASDKANPALNDPYFEVGNFGSPRAPGKPGGHTNESFDTDPTRSRS